MRVLGNHSVLHFRLPSYLSSPLGSIYNNQWHEKNGFMMWNLLLTVSCQESEKEEHTGKCQCAQGLGVSVELKLYEFMMFGPSAFQFQGDQPVFFMLFCYHCCYSFHKWLRLARISTINVVCTLKIGLLFRSPRAHFYFYHTVLCKGKGLLLPLL